MSTASIESQNLDLNESSFLQEEPKQVESTWEGRKWSFLGPNANIPMFTHRLFALTSVAFTTMQWGLDIISKGGLSSIRGACLHASNLFEGSRNLIEYTYIVNTAYRATTEGPGYFIAKDQDANINWLKTLANTCSAAASIILPSNFIYTRLLQGNIGTNTNVQDLQNFIMGGFSRTKFIDAAAGAWALGTGLNLFISTRNIFDSFYTTLQKERSENKRVRQTNNAR